MFFRHLELLFIVRTRYEQDFSLTYVFQRPAIHLYSSVGEFNSSSIACCLWFVVWIWSRACLSSAFSKNCLCLPSSLNSLVCFFDFLSSFKFVFPYHYVQFIGGLWPDQTLEEPIPDWSGLLRWLFDRFATIFTSPGKRSFSCPKIPEKLASLNSIGCYFFRGK